MTAGTVAPMRLLDWDSAFFGFPIARVEPAALVSGGVAAWCGDHDVRCAYLLVDGGDSMSARRAAEQGFRLVDVRVTLTATREAQPPKFAGAIRPATAADIPALQGIARQAHRGSRFYADGQFDWSRCDDLFAHWIERSCQGWADQVFVFDHDGHTAGYMSLHDRGDRGEIGLVGVYERARGRGGASALLASARRWFDARGPYPVTVVTQGGNRAALALYQAGGFNVTKVELWYHRWFRP